MQFCDCLGDWEVEGSEGRYRGDKLTEIWLGWWTHNKVNDWCVVELCNWNMYNFNQFHLNKVNKRKKFKINILFDLCFYSTNLMFRTNIWWLIYFLWENAKTQMPAKIWRYSMRRGLGTWCWCTIQRRQHSLAPADWFAR